MRALLCVFAVMCLPSGSALSSSAVCDNVASNVARIPCNDNEACQVPEVVRQCGGTFDCREGRCQYTTSALGAIGDLTCDEVRTQYNTALFEIQVCTNDHECGTVLPGTSCGCTRDLVARIGVSDAVMSRFHQYLERHTNDCGEGFITTCDCPKANGFACINNKCAFNINPRLNGRARE